MALPDALGQALTRTVSLKGNYEIRPSQPVPELDAPPAVAFAARSLRVPDERLYALICDLRTPVRTDALRALSRLRHPNLVSVMEWGVVDWPPERRRLAVVLGRPSGARLMSPDLSAGRPIREKRLVQSVLMPLIEGLAALEHLGVLHGSIRPDNIFVDGDSVVLGEGYAAPAGLMQPVLFQTLERGMAMPEGRGEGCRGDDLYALGVTLLLLRLGRNPLPDDDDEAILSRKLGLGTYGALVGDERLSPTLTEVLKGLLADDPASRWTLDELHRWVGGERRTPRQPSSLHRVRRPFVFRDKEYVSCRALAHDFAQHWDEAGTAILRTDFDGWVRRGIGNDEQTRKLLKVIAATGRIGVTGEIRDRMIARVLMALDPAAPIRFKGLSFMIDGFGPVLAAAEGNLRVKERLHQMLVDQAPIAWGGMQPKPRRDLLHHLQLFQRLLPALEESTIGFGIEHWLYAFNPEMPCLSPLVERDYVTRADGIVSALERVAQLSERRPDPMDRHLAAFIAVRTRPAPTQQLRDVGQGVGTPVGALALLDILASLQHRPNETPTPALANWVGGLMTPVINGFRSQARRKRLTEAMQAAMTAGNLAVMFRLLSDWRERARDTAEYDKATADYRMALVQITRLEEARALRPQIAERIGGQVSVVVSTAIGSVLMLINFLVFAIL
jgi:hypothetical protein